MLLTGIVDSALQLLSHYCSAKAEEQTLVPDVGCQ